MLRYVLAIVALFAVTGCSWAQTDAEKAACRPDVFKLCKACIPAALFGNRACIYECFASHRRALSLSCNRVLKSHGY